jgi:curved DNA-binding protein CbpA
MSSERIKEAWRKLGGRTGPQSMKDFGHKREAAREYAQAILSTEDKRRIKAIGRKYLILAAEGEMEAEQFVGFLKNAAIYEHWRA